MALIEYEELLPKLEDLEYPYWLEAQKYCQSTLEQYVRYYHMFKKYPLTQGAVDRFVFEHNHAIARAFLISYLKFLKNREIEVLPIRGRIRNKIPKYLSMDEIMALVRGSDFRTGLMILLYFETGLRAFELLKTRVKDIDFDNLKINGLGKGNKEFSVHISKSTSSLLLKYIHTSGVKEEDRLFKINRQRWDTILKKFGWAILHKNIHCHMLRHSVATYLAQRGENILFIQQVMRHADLNMTNIYIHLNSKEIEDKWREIFD